ncbi:hypothetical protein LPTSP4_21340 [Leptospira ryugenii]|uniref:Uncharacterized protein n=1 Tax=Leptospira ryugenii TaxID=1917863 RepID=A0A2P2E144_9LEPT|nr:hypothetical protein LPTSP4_21340 [Leptospira ryugenii]
MNPETQRILLQRNPEEDFLYQQNVRDVSSLPFIETTISLNLSPFYFTGFTFDGNKLVYSTRGESVRHSRCNGNICIILTDRNLLAISNYDTQFSKSPIFNEANFKVKLGTDAGYVLTERNIYVYNGILNQWKQIGIESESVKAMSSRKQLGLILTSKRILFIDFYQDEIISYSHPSRNFHSIEIKDRHIYCYAIDRVISYDFNTKSVEELPLDRQPH